MMRIDLIVFGLISFTGYCMAANSSFEANVTNKQAVKIVEHLKRRGLDKENFSSLNLSNCYYGPDKYLEGVTGDSIKSMKIEGISVPAGASILICKNGIGAVYAKSNEIIEAQGLNCLGELESYKTPNDPSNSKKLFECSLGRQSKFDKFLIPSAAYVRFTLQGDGCFWVEKSQTVKENTFKALQKYKISNHRISEVGVDCDMYAYASSVNINKLDIMLDGRPLSDSGSLGLGLYQGVEVNIKGDWKNLKWNLGDGREAKSPVILLSYKKTGSYVLTVTAEDNFGNKSKNEHKINVDGCVDCPVFQEEDGGVLPQSGAVWTIADLNGGSFVSKDLKENWIFLEDTEGNSGDEDPERTSISDSAKIVDGKIIIDKEKVLSRILINKDKSYNWIINSSIMDNGKSVSEETIIKNVYFGVGNLSLKATQVPAAVHLALKDKNDKIRYNNYFFVEPKKPLKLEGLPPGTYDLTIEKNNKKSTRKIEIWHKKPVAEEL